MIVLENVTGLFDQRSAGFFDAICDALTAMGYVYGVLQMDAALWVPQSRPRVFVVAVDAALPIPAELTIPGPDLPFHTDALTRGAPSPKGSADLVASSGSADAQHDVDQRAARMRPQVLTHEQVSGTNPARPQTRSR